MAKVAIIGAGIAGLACANHLTGAGHRCTVFEKSRGLGGRVATRRAGDLRFDHGAQFATVRDPAFRAHIEDAIDAGHAAPWPCAHDARDAFVGLPGMNGMVKPLASGADIRLMSRVLGIGEHDGHIRVMIENKGFMGGFDAVVVAIPAPQAIDLLGRTAPFDIIASVSIAPSWSGLFAFDARLPIETDVLKGEGDMAWAARNGSKPGRSADVETWVVHASPDWSKAHLERNPDQMIEPLLSAFYAFARVEPVAPTYAATHRWRHARTETPLGQPFLFDPDRRIIVCGDWCLGHRIEDGFCSGIAAAGRLEAVLDPAPPVLPSVGSFG